MKVNGQIEIDSTKKTVTVHLENGSFCLYYYTHGLKRFLDDEIECLNEQESKENSKRRDQLHYDVLNLIGMED